MKLLRVMTVMFAALALMLAVSCDSDSGNAATCDPACDADTCMTCVDGACQTKCATGETCNAGTCEAAATCDPTCDANACETCNNGTCESSCAADQTCNAGVCEGGTANCDPACDANACETCNAGTCESTCTANQTCNAGTCEAAATCDPACDADACEACVDGSCASTCEAGEVCNAGTCEADTTCDPACDADACEACLDGACASTCTGAEVCETGECVVPCDPACTGEQICVDGVCQDPAAGACENADDLAILGDRGDVCVAGTCAAITTDCDPACDAEADELCVSGICQVDDGSCDPACRGVLPTANDIAKACLLGPCGTSGGPTCFADCIANGAECDPVEGTGICGNGLSADCAVCYGNTTVCAAQFCLVPCLSDPNGEPCVTCLIEHCIPDFCACTGAQASSTCQPQD